MRSYGCESMTKRKRDIFTVIEAVPNWFEAGEGNTIISDTDAGSSNWAGSREGLVEYSAGEAVLERANQAASRGEIVDYEAGKAVPGKTNRVSSHEVLTEYGFGETTLGAAYVAPDLRLFQGAYTEDTSSKDIQYQATLTNEVNEWLTAARPPVNRIEVESKLVTAEDSSDTRGQALNAFWSLLKTAGYEEW